jgi:hypothetical protein
MQWFFSPLPVTRAHPFPFDGDFRVANRDWGEQQGTSEAADRGAERHAAAMLRSFAAHALSGKIEAGLLSANTHPSIWEEKQLDLGRKQ